MDNGHVLLPMAFIILGTLWAWLLWRRSWKATMRQLFVIVASFAPIAALATPNGQEFLRTHNDLFGSLAVGSILCSIAGLLIIALFRTT